MLTVGLGIMVNVAVLVVDVPSGPVQYMELLIFVVLFVPTQL